MLGCPSANDTDNAPNATKRRQTSFCTLTGIPLPLMMSRFLYPRMESRSARSGLGGTLNVSLRRTTALPP